MSDRIECVERDGNKIHFHVTNEDTEWRVSSFWRQEPETLAWIDTFKPDDLFVDVGANIGIYTLYAAVFRKVFVLAFEPESLNFAMLNRNIFINKLDKQIKAYPLALSDEFALSDLHLSTFHEGGAHHNFKEKHDFKGRPFKPKFSQGCLSITLDELVQRQFIPVPQHIKIDVDGIEDKVLKGAAKILANPQLHSVLVELNRRLPAHHDMIGFMQSQGFQLLPDHSRIRTGDFEGQFNAIFSRLL